MAVLSQFFDPSQPAPAPAEQPTDAALASRVAKLVEFASRNGPSFVALIQGKQKVSAWRDLHLFASHLGSRDPSGGI